MGLSISVGGDIAEEVLAFEAVEFSAHGAYFPAGEHVGDNGVTPGVKEVELFLC